MPPVAQATAREQTARQATYSLPFILVLAYVFVDFGRPQDWIPPLQLLHPGVIVLGGGIFALIFYRSSSIPKIGKYLLAFLFIMAIGTLFAYNKHMAFIATKDLALLLFGAVLPIMIFVDSYRKIQVLFRFWVFIHILLALYSIRHGGMGTGYFLADENDFCLVINMVLPYAFFMLFTVKSKAERFFLVIIIVVFFLAIVSTMSRGGFLGLLAVALFCWFFTPRKILSFFIILALSISFFIVTPDSYWKEMNTIKTSTQEEDTGYQRLYLWGIAWKLFLHDPVIGVGPTNFQYRAFVYESEYEKERGFHVWGRVCHSLYLTLLSEEGLLGAAVFLLILLSAWKERKKIRSYYKKSVFKTNLSNSGQEKLRMIYYMTMAVDASLMAYLVTGAFITVLYYPHFWLLTAFSVVLKKVFDVILKEEGAKQGLGIPNHSLQTLQAVHPAVQ